MQEKDQQVARKSTSERAQWLRASNDGLLLTTSLILRIGAAKEDHQSMVLLGITGAIAGALSMAVSTQRDIEMSMRREKMAVVGRTEDCAEEKHYDDNIKLGRVNVLASESSVRVSLAEDNGKSDSKIMASGQKGVVDDEVLANPYIAAAALAFSFLCRVTVPIVPALVVTKNKMRVVAVAVVASVTLAMLRGIGAFLGGSSVRVSAMRVLAGGWIAMGITCGLLKIFYRDDDDD